MARYQVKLAYDGTSFQGFQKQARVVTVQGAFEAALRELGWQGSSILAAGRTDTGVHAIGQVVAFDLDWQHPTEALLAALNAYLPREIAAQSAARVRDDFHPRYDAISRCYRYHIFCREVRSPLRERYAWRVWPVVDFDRMEKAAEALTGTHDYASFGTPPRSGGSTRRTVMGVSWRAVSDGIEPPELIFEISADAFLYHMVRRLVHMLVRIGQGRLEAEIVSEYLAHPGQNLCQGIAPPQGLTLVSVSYPDEAGGK